MNNASDFIRNANCCFVLSKAKAVTIAEDVTLPASAGYFVYTKFFLQCLLPYTKVKFSGTTLVW